MGWGASIEVAREARAAQTALQHGDAGDAAAHAQRAVKAAPQNPDLWFTLAYAARLSGQYSLSVDAYHRGLALKPSSVEGLSGLAQTYARMGRKRRCAANAGTGFSRESQKRSGPSTGGRTAALHRSEAGPGISATLGSRKGDRRELNFCWPAPMSEPETASQRTTCWKKPATRLPTIPK